MFPSRVSVVNLLYQISTARISRQLWHILIDCDRHHNIWLSSSPCSLYPACRRRSCLGAIELPSVLRLPVKLHSKNTTNPLLERS